MNITFYNFTGNKFLVDKTNYLEGASTIQGTLRSQDRGDIINPVILVERANFPKFNYAYIEEYDRYYFITDIITTRENLFSISLHVDVLYSFKDSIYQQRGIVNRQETDYNPYLIDSQIPFTTETTHAIKLSSESPLFNWYHNSTTISENNKYPCFVLVGLIKGYYTN